MIYRYVGHISPFKITPIETPGDTSLDGWFQSKYCHYRLTNLMKIKPRLTDLVKRENNFAGQVFSFPLYLDKK